MERGNRRPGRRRGGRNDCGTVPAKGAGRAEGHEGQVDSQPLQGASESSVLASRGCLTTALPSGSCACVHPSIPQEIAGVAAQVGIATNEMTVPTGSDGRGSPTCVRTGTGGWGSGEVSLLLAEGWAVPGGSFFGETVPCWADPAGEARQPRPWSPQSR